jgi:uncharacterized protein YlxW (UPF0749 family)
MAGEEVDRRQPAGPPPHAVMGLLDYISAHALDEDYASSAQRHHGEAAGAAAGRPRTAALVALAVFGLLLATAAVQTSRNAVVSASGHDELVQQVNARKAQLADRRARAGELRSDVGTLQSAYLDVTTQGRSLQVRLDRLGVATGSVPVRGPGVRIVVDDAPNATVDKQRVLDVDLQKLVNALWLLGAEAIAINGQRITSLTAIRHAGSAITVNFDSLRRPYTVSAIGNDNQMAARLLETAGGQTWLNLKSVFGMKFDITTEESMKLPAASRLNLRHARTPRKPEKLR